VLSLRFSDGEPSEFPPRVKPVDGAKRILLLAFSFFWPGWLVMSAPLVGGCHYQAPIVGLIYPGRMEGWQDGGMAGCTPSTDSLLISTAPHLQL